MKKNTQVLRGGRKCPCIKIPHLGQQDNSGDRAMVTTREFSHNIGAPVKKNRQRVVDESSIR